MVIGLIMIAISLGILIVEIVNNASRKRNINGVGSAKKSSSGAP